MCLVSYLLRMVLQKVKIQIAIICCSLLSDAKIVSLHCPMLPYLLMLHSNFCKVKVEYNGK